jgi:hypothetical protein
LVTRGRSRKWLLAGAVVAGLGGAAPAQGYVNWPGYLLGPDHTSVNTAATAITAAHAPLIQAAWSKAFNPGGGIVSSPTVYNGSVYIGGLNGFLYRLSESTGAVLGSINVGGQHSCTAGVASTVTVAPDPSLNGAATLYVSAGNPSSFGGTWLWALDAQTLQPVWSVDPVLVDGSNSFAWSSPTISAGQISVGISSDCEPPLARGGLAIFKQSDGSPVGTYYSVPPGSLGGTIWSSAAASGTTEWVTTGNADETPGAIAGDSFSIVRLNGATKVDSWTVPNLNGTDSDFGASPVLFGGFVNGAYTSLVGACNKNGIFYALPSGSLSSGPAWTFRIGGDDASEPTPCLSAAAWDATDRQLVIGGNHTSTAIDGVQWGGSIRALSPDDHPAHRVLWEMGLPCPVLGTPAENGLGVVAVATWGDGCMSGSSPTLYLLNARSLNGNPLGNPNPKVLKTITLSSGAFSQPTFADGYLFVATMNNGLMAYH